MKHPAVLTLSPCFRLAAHAQSGTGAARDAYRRGDSVSAVSPLQPTADAAVIGHLARVCQNGHLGSPPDQVLGQIMSIRLRIAHSREGR